MSIAFIAPFEQLRIKAQSIIDTAGYPAMTYLGDLDKGVQAARRAMKEGARIIISRGGTARLIRQKLAVEVLEVNASVYRTLSFLYEDTTQETRIAIVGYRQFMDIVEPVCDILRRCHQSFEIRDRLTFSEVVDAVKDWQPDVVIGDAVSYYWAKDYGLNAYLIESSMETIVDAFERALLVLNNLNKQTVNLDRLSAVLNCTKDGAVLVNTDGVIEEVNKQGCAILGTTRRELTGSLFSDYLKSKELAGAFEKKQEIHNCILQYKGKELAIDHFAVVSGNNLLNSAVILFQPIARIRETDNAIRRKLVDSGFYAKYTFGDILHTSKNMQQLVARARQYATTTSNIIITGETGTGKELFAQSIHNFGPLADGPFVAVNCAALSGSLLESELFGYAPGAFTGALRSGKIGLFELAQDGTLFLDELTEMDIFLQAKLLRALQTKEIMKIGDNKVIPINVRIIAATNRQPMEAVENGTLRMDLYFRLNVLDLHIPPLRHREDDVEYLFTRILKKRARELHKSVTSAPENLFEAMRTYAWPGNVRELENYVEKYLTLQEISQHTTLQPPMHQAKAPSTPEGSTLDAITAAAVLRVYRQENGNISRTAKILDVDRNTVKRWLRKNTPSLE